MTIRISSFRAGSLAVGINMAGEVALISGGPTTPEEAVHEGNKRASSVGLRP
jgi:hypothetical protein